ncbi:MAG: type II toxin-antitoxin system HicB family antitoxin [archaeon]
MDLDIVFEKQKEGGYTAYVPALPGCVSEGETKTEARRNIAEAIEIYVEEAGKAKAKELARSIFVEKTRARNYA